jgi:hypothetical protein
MHRLTKLFLALALVMSVGGLTAGVIDFNTVPDGGAVASLSDGPVTVSFFTGSNATVCPAGVCAPALGSAYGAVNGGPTTAFDTNDNRAGGGDSPFLTDEPTGPSMALDYFLSFNISVPDLTLDLLDYGGDGGAPAGNFATLQVFSSNDWDPANLITSISGPPIVGFTDGLVTSLSLFPGTPILSARVTFSTPDVGTGIDNVSWTTTPIPEPGTVVLFGTGLLGLAAFARKRRGRA